VSRHSSPMPDRSGTEPFIRRRSWVVLVLLALVAGLLSAAGPAQGLHPRLTGPLLALGFPQYYTDNSGLSLRLCEDGSVHCLGNTRNAPGLRDRTNGEAFYWQAAASLPTKRGTLEVELALEAAYAARNVPEVFSRLRIRGHLNRAGSYRLYHPYGSVRIVAGSPTQQRNVNFTSDLPCPLGPGSCGRIRNFLRSRTLGVGYVGFNGVPTRVTGGSERNFVALRGRTGRLLGQQSRFIVVGKVRGSQAVNQVSASSISFGNTARTRTRSLVMHNVNGRFAMSLSRLELNGTSRITVARRGCALVRSLAPGGTCRVTLVYHPLRARTATGALVFTDNTLMGRHRIPVRASTASVASAARRVGFGARRVHTTGAKHRIRIRNTGVRTLVVKSVRLGGTSARSFVRRPGADRCVRGTHVRPGTSCSVYVAFRPRGRGARTARVVVVSNALNRSRVVTLTGRGRGR
jgi:hypothetical protein